MTPNDDAQIAMVRGMTFEVCSKERHGAPWVRVATGLADVREAFAAAKQLNCYEAGVITAGPPPLAGFVYWTTRHPDLFNSTVITQAVS